MKILASDLDDTLLVHSDKDITKKNVEAVKKFINAGNKFVIITGRQYKTFKEFLDENKITCEYIAGEDGAIIFDKDLKEVYRKNIDQIIVDEISLLVNKYNLEVKFDDGYNYYPQKQENNTIKIVFPKKEIEEHEEVFNKIKSFDKLNIYFSYNWLNVIEEEMKYKVIDFIKSREGISDEDIYTVGDGPADVLMIKKYNGEMLGKGRFNYLYEYIEELMKD